MHVHIKCHSMKDLPESDDAIAQWCRDQFVAKVKIMDIVTRFNGREKLS